MPRLRVNALRLADDRLAISAQHVVDRCPPWSLGFEGATHTLNITANDASFAANAGGPGSGSVGTRTFRYRTDPSDIEAERFEGWLEQALRDVLRGEHIERQQVLLYQLLRDIEHFVYQIDLALQENSRLQSQLREARIEIDFLRRQLSQVTEAISTDRPRLARAMLAGLGAILLAITTGAAEGMAGLVVDDNDRPPVAASDYLEQCDGLVERFDLVGVEGP
jgi:hypothetical protein